MRYTRFLAGGLLAAAIGVGLSAPLARAADKTSIDFYFPAAVQGPLAREMERIVKEFNDKTPDVEVVGVFTGNYDDERVKIQAAVEAGKPPAVALASANYVLEFALGDQIEPIENYLVENGQDPKKFLDDFWPAVRPNAIVNGKVYAIPYQNSTPILYINADQFKEVGLDPEHPPATWAELLAAAQKLTKRDGDKVVRYGIEMPSGYDYVGWLVQTLAMSNGGQFYNPAYGGEVYYDTPSTLGAVQFWGDLANRSKVMPSGVIEQGQVATDFYAGRAAMIVMSTGALSAVRKSTEGKFAYNVGFIPRNVLNSVPIGGGSLVAFKGLTPDQRKAAWKFMSWMSSPEQLGAWSRFTGYFAPRISAYDLPEMKAFAAQHPDALKAVEQLKFAGPWLATYNTVAVRKALDDEMQAVLSGKKDPAQAVKDAQKNANEILRPFTERITKPIGS